MAKAIGNGIARKFSFESFYFFTLLLLEFSHGQSSMSDILRQGQELTTGSQLISATGVFVLGFYNHPHNSNPTYIRISYKNDPQTPLWIANRNFPFPNNSVSISLTIDATGSLKILGKVGNDGYVYSFSLFDVGQKTTSSAILQDDGNFVLRELNRDGSVKQILWQSFDHPTDTLLPGMKIGINRKTNSISSLKSWLTRESPKVGEYTLAMNPNNTNQLLMSFQASVFWTSGNWTNGWFEFLKNPFTDQEMYFDRVSNENETYFIYTIPKLKNQEILPRFKLDMSGSLNWDKGYGSYRLNSYCTFFENEFSNDLEDGCVRKSHYRIPKCRNGFNGDSLMSGWRAGYMVGDGSKYEQNTSGNLTVMECGMICISNCDCNAFSFSKGYNINSRCEIWSNGSRFRSVEMETGGQWIWMLNTTYYHNSFIDDQSLYASAAPEETRVWFGVFIGLAAVAIILLMSFILCLKWKKQVIKVIEQVKKKILHGLGVISKSFNTLRIINKRTSNEKNSELQCFDFETIVSATNNFANEYKLGQGGFGLVYKASLADGQEVAIKRLSKNSGQGLVEYKNETILIAKLQHTNLVRLIGYCIYKEEKLLVYEYMPNKSLDSFLFDSEKKLILDWEKRLHIIQGIIQGLLYLHYYSRVRILHRDLKVSNILLDDEMNAKISDFGMARVFKQSDNEANTSGVVVGTYGYISPEYAREGIYSIKSDVYSFGVLLLEIITGQKNYNNYDEERPLNLIGYAWELLVNDRGEELIDSALCNSKQKPKALRCIHVGLLCVQKIPVDRPTMLDVHFMIHNDSIQLPPPKKPAFFIAQNSQSLEVEATVDSALRLEPTQQICSLSTMSISVVVAR